MELSLTARVCSSLSRGPIGPRLFFCSAVQNRCLHAADRATIRSASQANSLAWFLRYRDRLSFAAGSQHAFHTCAGCGSRRRQRIIPVDHIPQSPRKQHRREIRVMIFSSFLFGLFVQEFDHRQLPHHKTSATRGAMWPTALCFTHAHGKGTK